MLLRGIILSLIFSLFPIFTFAAEKQKSFRMVFYNVENLFYPSNDSLTLDDEFTPKGERYWTFIRYNQKLIRIGKVITACSEGVVPDLVGLCEIENRRVLEELLQRSSLKALGYQIIHKESPDKRGIDVALLYKSDRFNPLNYRLHKVGSSREILEVTGIAHEDDTISVFVNHWPSRYSGVLASRTKRIFAANVLSHAVDSITSNTPQRHIIICGDFNDEPHDESIKGLLNNRKLKNFSLKWESGTLKHQGQWNTFDQFIVSDNVKGAAEVYFAPYLLESDTKYLGKRPFRTYVGYRYHGGFSDHLPIVAELQF